MNKRTKQLIAAVCAALVLTAVYLAVRPRLKPREEPGKEIVPVVLEEGEAYYRYGGREYPTVAVVYPTLGRSDIMQVTVHPADGSEYLFFHDLRSGTDVFYLGQFDGGSYDAGDEPTFYFPAVARESADFDFSTLYDATGRVPAMLSAVGSVIIGDRVYRWGADTPADEVQQNLHRFGLADADGAPWFEVVPYLCDRTGYHIMTETGDPEDLWYLNPYDGYYYHKDGVAYIDGAYTYNVAYIYGKSSSLLRPVADVTSARRVYVGRATPDAGGYYLYLEGRGTVYTTATVATSVADVDLSNLVHRSLAWYVRPRLLTDAVSVYDPYFTPHLSFGTGRAVADGEPVSPGDTVFVRAADGTSAILSEADGALFDRLVGARVGETGLMTLGEIAAYTRPIREGDVISYTFGEILWVYDPASRAETDAPAAADSVVCVRFRTPADGEDENGAPVWHETMLDLSSPDLPASVRDAVIGRARGEDVGETADVIYHVPAGAQTVEYGIVRIRQVLHAGAETDEPAVPGDAVFFEYRISVDGTIIGADAAVLVLDPGSPDSEIAALSGRLVGQSTATTDTLTVTLSIVDDLVWADADTVMRDLSVEYAVACETTLALSHYAFVGSGERDVFYGEAIHVITAPDELVPYTVNDATVTRLLQTLAAFAGASIPSSAIGGYDATALETAAVAPDGRLTGELIRTYGLYARTLTYVLPINVSVTASGQYRADGFRTFRFFLSTPDENGLCYVACDAFGTVIRAEAGLFEPLDREPLENWTRANLIQTAVDGIASVTFDLAYTDATATHTFWLSVDDAFTYISGGTQNTISRLYVAYTDGLPQTTVREDANIRPGPGVAVRGGRVILLADAKDLDAVYREAGHDERSGIDGAGVTHFRKLMASFYSMYYQGTVGDALDDAAIAAVLADPDAATLTVSVTLVDGRTFSYAFCPYSARRSLVVLRSYDKNGAPIFETAAFYVNTSEADKLARMATDLASGVVFDEDDVW